MIFRKTLTLSAEARQKAEGKSDAAIHALLGFHANNVATFLLVFHLLMWSAPLQILLYNPPTPPHSSLPRHVGTLSRCTPNRCRLLHPQPLSLTTPSLTPPAPSSSSAISWIGRAPLRAC